VLHLAEEIRRVVEGIAASRGGTAKSETTGSSRSFELVGEYPASGNPVTAAGNSLGCVSHGRATLASACDASEPLEGLLKRADWFASQCELSRSGTVSDGPSMEELMGGAVG